MQWIKDSPQRSWQLCAVLLVSLLPRHSIAEQSTFSVEPINFQSAGVTLSGTIFQPRQALAAVVIVHGSGQEKRMAGFAAMLASKGIAVLTYDKRGVGESGGVYAGPEVGTNNVDRSNLALLAGDASAAVNALIAHLPSNRGPAGLLGFSQAGWIIPLAAKANPAVKFMVLFSGPVVTTREQLRFQFLTAGDPKFWDVHSEAEARTHMRDDPDRFQFVDTDPTDTLATLTIPGLWLFGGRDVLAPVQLSIERLERLRALGKPFEYRLFPRLGHNVAPSDESESFVNAVHWVKSIANETSRKGGSGHVRNSVTK